MADEVKPGEVSCQGGLFIKPLACVCTCHTVGIVITHDEPCCQLYGHRYLAAHNGHIIRTKLIAAIISKSLFEPGEVEVWPKCTD